jgi:hypothetical protein
LPSEDSKGGKREIVDCRQGKVQQYGRKRLLLWEPQPNREADDKKEGGLMTIEYGEFKGNRMIILKRSEEDRYPFMLPKSKARLIVENYEEIRKFAEED